MDFDSWGGSTVLNPDAEDDDEESTILAGEADVAVVETEDAVSLQSSDLGMDETEPAVTQPRFTMLLEGKESEIIYSRATSPQITALHREKAVHWAGRMSMKDYMEVAKAQFKLILYQKQRYPSWFVLFPKGSPHAVLSSCVVYLRDTLINTGEGPYVGKAAMIAEVFTHVKARRQGLATYLLKRVQETLDQKRTDRAAFSVVWSDADTTLASRLGWKPMPLSQLRMVVKRDAPKREDDLCITYCEGASVVKHLASMDVDMCMRRSSGARERNGALVQILPSNETMLWHMYRNSRISAALKTNVECKRLGCLLQSDERPEHRVLLWFFPDFSARRLYIGRAMSSRKSEEMEGILKAALVAAMAEARRCKFEEAILWDPDRSWCEAASQLVWEQQAIIYHERVTDQVPCLRWQNGLEKEVDWQGRQRYTYC